jgi:hypothetical protein
VQFVGVKITNVDPTGGNKAIMVQPVSHLDPNAMFSNVAPASPPSGTTTLTTTFVGAKLIR